MRTLPLELVIGLHDEAVCRTGGCPGILDEGRLAAAALLELNGLRTVASPGEIEDTVVAMATGDCGVDDFAAWVEDHTAPSQ